MKKICIRNNTDEPLEHYEHLDLRGELETLPLKQQSLSNHLLGTLRTSHDPTDKNKTQHTLVIERKKLTGKTELLRKPLVLIKGGEEGYEVLGVIEKSVLFKTQPTPIEKKVVTTPVGISGNDKGYFNKWFTPKK